MVIVCEKNLGVRRDEKFFLNPSCLCYAFRV